MTPAARSLTGTEAQVELLGDEAFFLEVIYTDAAGERTTLTELLMKKSGTGEQLPPFGRHRQGASDESPGGPWVDAVRSRFAPTVDRVLTAYVGVVGLIVGTALGTVLKAHFDREHWLRDRRMDC